MSKEHDSNANDVPIVVDSNNSSSGDGIDGNILEVASQQHDSNANVTDDAGAVSSRRQGIIRTSDQDDDEEEKREEEEEERHRPREFAMRATSSNNHENDEEQGATLIHAEEVVAVQAATVVEVFATEDPVPYREGGVSGSGTVASPAPSEKRDDVAAGVQGADPSAHPQGPAVASGEVHHVDELVCCDVEDGHDDDTTPIDHGNAYHDDANPGHHHAFVEEVDFDEEQSITLNINAASRTDHSSDHNDDASLSRQPKHSYFYHFLILFLVIVGYILVVFIVFGAIIDREWNDYPGSLLHSDNTTSTLQKCWDQYEDLRIHMVQLNGKAIIANISATIIMMILMHARIHAFLNPKVKDEEDDASSNNDNSTSPASTSRPPYKILFISLLEVGWCFTNVTSLICIDMDTTTPADDMNAVCEQDFNRRQIELAEEREANSEGDADIAGTDVGNQEGQAQSSVLAPADINLESYDLGTTLTLPLILFAMLFHLHTIFSYHRHQYSSSQHECEERQSELATSRHKFMATVAVPVAILAAFILHYVTYALYLLREIDKLDDYRDSVSF